MDMTKVTKVKIFNYGKYSSDNYGCHTLGFEDTAGNRFWFSYTTLVAFRPVGDKIYVHENVWGTVTGKHLNWIDGGNKKSRLSSDEFADMYKKFFENKKAA